MIKKAEQWRGKSGERRKVWRRQVMLGCHNSVQVAVYDYVWEEGDEADDKAPVTREVTTHVSVHTIYLDGECESCCCNMAHRRQARASCIDSS